MPAATWTILVNLDRTVESGDQELIDLLDKVKEEVETDPSDTDAWAHEVWSQFIEAADAAHIADRLPGTKGWEFRQEYGTLKTRGRKPVEKTVRLTEKQAELVDAGVVDFSDVIRYRRDGDKIVFTARTPMLRALRKSINSKVPDGRSAVSLRALSAKIKETA